MTLNSQEFILPKGSDVKEVNIAGKIGNYISGSPLEFILTAPDGSKKSIHVNPTSQGNYKVRVILSADSIPGEYSVALRYQNQDYENASFQVIRHVIPNWIKNNAEWWSDGKITRQDFVKNPFFDEELDRRYKFVIRN